MNRTIRFATAGFTALALVGLAFAAGEDGKNARGGCPMMKEHGGGGGGGLAGIPGLTPDQMEKIRQLKLDLQKELIPLHAQAQTIRVEMEELISKDSRAEAINAKIDEGAKVLAAMMKKRVAHHAEVAKLLTPEQRNAFKLRVPSLLADCRGWCGPGGGKTMKGKGCPMHDQKKPAGCPMHQADE